MAENAERAPTLLSALVAEALGVFALSFIGILAIHETQGGLVGVALAHGLILAVMITITAPISGGHINPAVTVGLLVLGKIKPPQAFAYIIAQCVGGLLAGLAVMAMMPTGGGAVVAAGTPMIGLNTANQPLMTLAGAVLAEAIATFFLMSAVLGTAVDPRAPRIGGFGIGLTVAADILAIGPLTGAAMNPARAFGPALAASMGNGQIPWGQHWIYWVAPIAGAVAAALLYRMLFEPQA